MLEKLHVQGFRTLHDTEVAFDPLTILIGKNGVGKTSILDVLQLLANYSRGGVARAFGPGPWSLGWQRSSLSWHRSKGLGNSQPVRFEVVIRTEGLGKYQYTLILNERDVETVVEEEKLLRLDDHRIIANAEDRHLRNGTILSPEPERPYAPEIAEVAKVFRSIATYELNPAQIEEATFPETPQVDRNGLGVASFLAHLKDNQPEAYLKLETKLKQFRPETETIDLWTSRKVYWSLRDTGQSKAIPACHLSWGDRQLVGLLSILFYAKSGSTITIEEIDRGFHPSRYASVVALLTEAAYKGVAGNAPLQIIVTTHSPSFLNKIEDQLKAVRVVTRDAGGTKVRSLDELLREKLGTDRPEAPLGEVWEMGLLEDAIEEVLA